MFSLQSTLLCLNIWTQLTRPEQARCMLAAQAAVDAADAHNVEADVLHAIGYRETRWTYQRHGSVCGAWQTAGFACDGVQTLATSADAGARALKWWQAAAARNKVAPRRALAGYACGYRGLYGKGCAWYVRDIEALVGHRL